MRFVWIFVCARHVSFLFTLNRLRRCLCFRDEAFWLGYSIAVVFRCIQAIAGHVSNFPATIHLTETAKQFLIWYVIYHMTRKHLYLVVSTKQF